MKASSQAVWGLLILALLVGVIYDSERLKRRIRDTQIALDLSSNAVLVANSTLEQAERQLSELQPSSFESRQLPIKTRIVRIGRGEGTYFEFADPQARSENGLHPIGRFRKTTDLVEYYLEILNLGQTDMGFSVTAFQPNHTNFFNPSIGRGKVWISPVLADGDAKMALNVVVEIKSGGFDSHTLTIP